MTIECDTTGTTIARTPFFIRRGSRNVTLKNLIVKGNRHSTGSIPSVVVIDNTGFASSGGQNDMTITNCHLMRGNNGIFTNAASGAVRDSNHTFTNNLIGGGSSPSLFDHLAAAGITMTGNHNVLVDSNDVNGIQVAGTPAGIRINGANTAVRVTRNHIHNLVTLAPAAARPLCFLVGNIIATGPGVMTQAVIANNMVDDIHNFGTGAAGRAVDGLIYNPTGGTNSPNGVGSNIEWYYNTWNINMAAGEGTGNVAFLFDANFAFSNPNPAHYDSIRFFNNVASIKRADSLASRMWLIFGEGTPGTNRLRSNNNLYDYYVGPFAQIPSPWPGGTTGVFVNTVAEFHDSTGLDANSVGGDPMFVSATNSHIRTDVPTPVESAGQIVASITRDFDNDLRFGSPGYTGNGTAPDLGADEGNFIPAGAVHDIGVTSVSVASAGSPTVANLPSQKGGTAGRAVLQSSRGISTFNNIQRVEVIPDVREQAAAGNISVAYISTDALHASSVSASPNTKPPVPTFNANTPINFSALVHNFGGFAEPTYQVAWTIDGTPQTPVSQPRALQIGATDTVTLTWAAPTVGNHSLRAFSVLASDVNHANDSASYNFTVQLTPGWTAQNSGITNQFYSVRAVDQSVIWAAAVGGRVLRSIDGGGTWTSVGGGPIGTSDIYNIDAVSASTAFVTTTPSTTTYIFRTTTGGASWDTVFTQAGGFIDAIHMFDATNGIALGDPVPAATWTIARTTNGGASWARIATEPTAVGGEAGTQNDLAVFGPSNIWFGASAGGRIYRSTNGGATWASSIVPGGVAGTRVISVWFNNANYGIAGHYTTSGVYNAARSTDGGVTWSAITVGTATTYNIAVSGSGVDGFWMGRGTNVFASTDRGATWTQSYTGTGTFYDVDFFTSGNTTYGWGVKDNGNIVMYFGTTTGVGETPQPQVPVTFALDQNYPNPFNPTTTLRYGIPRSSHVTLRIYNALGQEIATLRDEFQDVGFHEVVWNGRNNTGGQVASGVYFYRIEARPADGSEPFTSIKKMLMLK